jgi:hypothetical protein
VTTATRARTDTAYQRLREHLAYLGLTTAAEELAPALERGTSPGLRQSVVMADEGGLSG